MSKRNQKKLVISSDDESDTPDFKTQIKQKDGETWQEYADRVKTVASQQLVKDIREAITAQGHTEKLNVKRKDDLIEKLVELLTVKFIDTTKKQSQTVMASPKKSVVSNVTVG